MLSLYDNSRLFVLQLQAMSKESGEPVDLKSLRTVPLKDRVQCDCCAAAIADVYLTCSNEQCGDYDLCMKCSLDARKQDKVQEESNVSACVSCFCSCSACALLPLGPPRVSLLVSVQHLEQYLLMARKSAFSTFAAMSYQ